MKKEITSDELPELSNVGYLRIRNSRTNCDKPDSGKALTTCNSILKLFENSGLSYLEAKRVLDYVNQELLRKALERTN